TVTSRSSATPRGRTSGRCSASACACCRRRWASCRRRSAPRWWRSTADAADDSMAGTNDRKILVIDVGGTHVKLLATGKKLRRRFKSGPALTARGMVAAVKPLVADWTYDAVSIGVPAPVVRGRIVAE